MQAPRILYVTCGDNGLYGLQHLRSNGISVSRVVTISPEAARQYNVSGYTDVSSWCYEHDVPCTILHSYDLKWEDIADCGCDLLVVNGWNRLIRNDVISNFSLGGLGVHAGHPPIGLGRAPLVWNIILGRVDIEVYVFELTEDADDGCVLAQRPVEITPFDDVKMLYEKVMHVGAELVCEAVFAKVAGTVGYQQAEEFARHYSKRTPEDGIIDFSRSELEIYNFVRAQVPPYPGAFTYLGNNKCMVYGAVPFDRHAFRLERRVPGRIVLALPSGLVVLTGGSPIWLIEVSIDGEKLDFRAGRELIGKTLRSVPLD